MHFLTGTIQNTAGDPRNRFFDLLFLLGTRMQQSGTSAKSHIVEEKTYNVTSTENIAESEGDPFLTG